MSTCGVPWIISLSIAFSKMNFQSNLSLLLLAYSILWTICICRSPLVNFTKPLIISFLISVSFSSGVLAWYLALTISSRYAITGLSEVPALRVSRLICLSIFSSSVSGVWSRIRNLAVSSAVSLSVTMLSSGLNHEMKRLNTFLKCRSVYPNCPPSSEMFWMFWYQSVSLCSSFLLLSSRSLNLSSLSSYVLSLFCVLAATSHIGLCLIAFLFPNLISLFVSSKILVRSSFVMTFLSYSARSAPSTGCFLS